MRGLSYGRIDLRREGSSVSGRVLALAISLENRIIQEFPGEITISVYRSLPDSPSVSPISGTFLGRGIRCS
jgi:hypothetical protein